MPIETTRERPNESSIYVKPEEVHAVISVANDAYNLGLTIMEDGSYAPMPFPVVTCDSSGAYTEEAVMVSCQDDVISQLLKLNGPIDGKRMSVISIIAGLYLITTNWRSLPVYEVGSRNDPMMILKPPAFHEFLGFNY
jgi:hypothetical protein